VTFWLKQWPKVALLFDLQRRLEDLENQGLLNDHVVEPRRSSKLALLLGVPFVAATVVAVCNGGSHPLSANLRGTEHRGAILQLLFPSGYQTHEVKRDLSDWFTTTTTSTTDNHNSIPQLPRKGSNSGES